MDTENKQSLNLRLKWYGFGGAMVGLGFLCAYVLWPQLSLKTPADVIIIKAVDGPIKVKPSDPGGTAVPHQNLLVIDMLKNGIDSSDDVETLRPNPSKPEPPPIDGGKSTITNASGRTVSDNVEDITSIKKTESVKLKPNKKPENAHKKHSEPNPTFTHCDPIEICEHKMSGALTAV